MAKESVHRHLPATTSRRLIGQLVEHPIHGVGLVTGHIIYPCGRLDQPSSSVYQVLWAGSSTICSLSRKEMNGCSVVDTGRPLD